MVKSRSYIATPPGETIREQLKDRGMSQKEFAVRMDLSEKHVSKLINGEVQLTPEMAYRLEMVLGAPAKFWNNLEIIYREKLVKAHAENEMDFEIALAKQLPYSKMAQYGWVPKTKIDKEKAICLRKFFEVVNLSLVTDKRLEKVTFNGTEIDPADNPVVAVWIQKARIDARAISTDAVNVEKLPHAILDIKKIRAKTVEEFYGGVKQILSACGVAVVFLPHIQGLHIKGATFEDGKKIIIALKNQNDNMEKMRTSLFRELEQVEKVYAE